MICSFPIISLNFPILPIQFPSSFLFLFVSFPSFHSSEFPSDHAFPQTYLANRSVKRGVMLCYSIMTGHSIIVFAPTKMDHSRTLKLVHSVVWFTQSHGLPPVPSNLISKPSTPAYTSIRTKFIKTWDTSKTRLPHVRWFHEWWSERVSFWWLCPSLAWNAIFIDVPRPGRPKHVRWRQEFPMMTPHAPSPPKFF